MFKIHGHSLLKVKDIDGVFVLNKKKLKKSKILDENFFLYFETTDLCFNLIKKKHKMYVVKELEICASRNKFFGKKISASHKS